MASDRYCWTQSCICKVSKLGCALCHLNIREIGSQKLTQNYINHTAYPQPRTPTKKTGLINFNHESSNSDVAVIIEALDMNFKGRYGNMRTKLPDRMEKLFGIEPQGISANETACLLSLGQVERVWARSWGIQFHSGMVWTWLDNLSCSSAK